MNSETSAITRVTVTLLTVLLLAAAQPGAASTPPPVPAEFQDLYNTLNADLNDFDATLNGLWNGSQYPVLYTGQLTVANSNNGTQLLNSTFPTSVQSQLLTLKALGVQAVAVEVSFPMLYQPFFSSQTEYQQYVNAYAQVAAAVRAQGLKLIVESQSMMPNGLGSGWGPQVAAFYPTLNWTQYQAARAQAAQAVAQTMQPDYFVLLEEPDTEATQSGQADVNTVGGSTSMLDQMHSSVLLAGVPGIKIGAGIGSWLSGFQGFINSFTGQQCSASQPCVTLPLDFIDMHLFPVNALATNNFWTNALTIVNMTAAAGKPMTIAQTWLRKVRDSEWGVLNGDIMESREVFSFWAPLDAAFVQTVQNLANYAHMSFIAPFNTQNFSAYLTYSSEISNLSPSELFSREFSEASLAAQQGSYSSTGMSYYSGIVAPVDTIPPSMPAKLTAIAASPTAVNLSWNASTDSVGVAGYHIWRNGAPLPSTARAYLQDSGLTQNTAYTYQVEAFDLASNVSQRAVVTVKTRNSLPPNPPASLIGTAVSTQQIKLTWSPSTGNGIPSSYRLFRGSSPTSMTQLAQLSGTMTSFNDYHLAPGTTYYYGVEAVLGGLASPMSNVVQVTTLSLPSQPANLVATAPSAKQVKLTWSASTGGLPIGAYHVYRGTSPTSLRQVSLTINASYTDRAVVTRTTYYYSVQAADTLGNLSPMSVVVTVTTP